MAPKTIEKKAKDSELESKTDNFEDSIGYVSEEEQKEIEELHGEALDRERDPKDFITIN